MRYLAAALVVTLAFTACSGSSGFGTAPAVPTLSKHSGPASLASSPTRYTITDLGTGVTGHPGLVPIAINNSGVIVGISGWGGYAFRLYQSQAPLPTAKQKNPRQCIPFSCLYTAFVYQNGTLTVLPALTGDDFAAPSDINNSGLIAGDSGNANANTGHAVIWQSGQPVDIGGGSDCAIAGAVSNTGEIVGNACQPDGSFPLSTFDGSGDIAPLCGGINAGASAVNDNGLVVGQYFLAQGASSAFECAPLTSIVTTTIINTVESGFDVNNNGDVVGGMTLSNGLLHPFLYHNGVVSDLGTLTPTNPQATAAAFGINSSGVAVGFSATATPVAPTNSKAFVYTGQLVDLNTLIPVNSGWKLVVAQDINDAGQIIGAGTLKGVEHGFLLTPAP